MSEYVKLVGTVDPEVYRRRITDDLIERTAERNSARMQAETMRRMCDAAVREARMYRAAVLWLLAAAIAGWGTAAALYWSGGC